MTSTIKVDNIQKTSDDSNIIKKCGSTTTVGSGSGQTIVVCGATVTLGRCGGAVNLASGATQSGFGRTGTVDWQTSIKTSTITVVNGEGYFVDTTSGSITANLPAGSAGAIAAFRDYANTFDSNNLIIASNGSEKINGSTDNLIVSTEGESLTLVYADATKGWLVVNDGNNDAGAQAAFVTATGGTITTSGNFKIHTFTADGTFCVSNGGNPFGSDTVDYLVVAGGGGGGYYLGGAGGAGGYRESSGAASGCYSRSPLGACVAALPVSAQGYPITVGGGGAGGPSACQGGSSTFSTITSAGGGKGNGSGSGAAVGGNGGSGGGGGTCSGNASQGSPGGTGNTPPVSPPQGNNGGAGTTRGSSPYGIGAGGGGAGSTGQNGGPSPGGGGAGAASTILGSSPLVPSYGVAPNPSNTGPGRYFAGGGGGGWNGSGPGGHGGGGAGGSGSSGDAGTANTGGGGGADSTPSPYGNGGNGGSGIVIISHATADGGSGGNATATCGSDTIRVFTSDGTFTA